MLYIANAFSLNMFEGEGIAIRGDKIPARTAAALVAAEEVVSAIGHADTKRVVEQVLGRSLPQLRGEERPTLLLGSGSHKLLIAQYRGPRLAEGATTLPSGATIEWWLLEVEVA